MDMDVDIEEEKKRLKNEYAEIMFDRFMQFLTSDTITDNIWKNASSCCKHFDEQSAVATDSRSENGSAKKKAAKTKPKQRCMAECLTPVGLHRQMKDGAVPGSPRKLRVASAGTVCVDVSAMGALGLDGRGLRGCVNLVRCCDP